MNDINPPAVVTPTPGAASPQPSGPLPTTLVNPPRKSGSGGRIVMILIALILIAAAGFGGYSYGKSKAPTKVVTKTETIPPLTVPQGATVLSQCAPGKGALYALPKDIPTGPVYLVNNGNVIGLEFMVGKDDLLKKGKSFLNLPMFGQKFDHANIGLLSEGHAGFPVPHYHVDLFTVPDSVASSITCPAS